MKRGAGNFPRFLVLFRMADFFALGRGDPLAHAGFIMYTKTGGGVL
jgi:hypothetical protein